MYIRYKWVVLVFHPVLFQPLSSYSGMEYTRWLLSSSLGWRAGEVIQSSGSEHRYGWYDRWYVLAGVASLQHQFHQGWSRRSGTVPLSPSPRVGRAGHSSLSSFTFAEFPYPRRVLSTPQGCTANALLPNVYWLRRQVCRRLPCPGGRGYVPFVLLVLVVRD